MGRERGEALMEILEKKTIESKKREKVVKERSVCFSLIPPILSFVQCVGKRREKRKKDKKKQRTNC